MIGKRILVVDDEENLRRVTQLRLQQAGYEATTAGDGKQALDVLSKHAQDLVLTDLKMPGMSGIELLQKIKQEYPEVIVVVVTAFASMESAVDAMQRGAYDYIIKPVNSDSLKLIVSRALEYHRLQEEVRNLHTTIDRKFGFENIIGKRQESDVDVWPRFARSSERLHCADSWRNGHRYEQEKQKLELSLISVAWKSLKTNFALVNWMRKS